MLPPPPTGYRAAGLDHLIEEETRCCHATQNKVWATEPQGLRWEWYRITDDTDALFDALGPRAVEAEAACCPTAEQPDCCPPSGKAAAAF